MRTRCPHCHTAYDVDPQTLQPSQGLARCHRCTRIFNAFQNPLDATPAPPPPEAAIDPLFLDEPDPSLLVEDRTFAPPSVPVPEAEERRRDPAPTAPARPEDSTIHAPSDEPPPTPDVMVVDELPTATSAPLDQDSLLNPPPPKHTPWWQKLLVLILSLTLLAQTAWIRRDLWIDLPQAAQLCAILDCELPGHYRPQDFTVIERDMQAEPGPPAALRLWLAIRNDAPFAQPLPRLQLALQDSTGALVARRLFTPEQYLPPDWSGPPAAPPGEVVTIELRLKDPGPRAQGFVIDFL